MLSHVRRSVNQCAVPEDRNKFLVNPPTASTRPYILQLTNSVKRGKLWATLHQPVLHVLKYLPFYGLMPTQAVCSLSETRLPTSGTEERMRQQVDSITGMKHGASSSRAQSASPRSFRIPGARSPKQPDLCSLAHRRRQRVWRMVRVRVGEEQDPGFRWPEASMHGSSRSTRQAAPCP